MSPIRPESEAKRNFRLGMKDALQSEGGTHRFIVDSVGKDLYYKTLKMKKT